MSQERFHYKTLEEVKERAEELKVWHQTKVVIFRKSRR